MLLERLTQSLADVGCVERATTFVGYRMLLVLRPNSRQS